MCRAQSGQVFKIQNDCSNTFISFRAFNHLDQIAQNDLVLLAVAQEPGLQWIADAFMFNEQTAWLEEQRGVVVDVLALATADKTAGENEQDQDKQGVEDKIACGRYALTEPLPE